MGDAVALSGAADSREYGIRRTPDLAVVSPGAQLRYVCEWRAPGPRPRVASDGYWGPRDGIRWYLYSDKPPSGWFQKQVTAGPVQDEWTRDWKEDPGSYTVIAEIRSALDASRTPPTYCYQPQQVGDAGAILNAPLDRLIEKGVGPSPDEALKEIDRYRALLDDVARRFPPADQQRYREVVDKWDDLGSRLNGLISPSAGKRRIAMRALHLEHRTQLQRPLLLFLTEGSVDRGGDGRGDPLRSQKTSKQWSLVDWTDPTDPRFRGTYEGSGDTDQQAIAACLAGWNVDNRYPAGHVTYDLPAELRGGMGQPARRGMETDGKSFTDQVIVVFEWIAFGSLVVAGFCFIFVAVPALVSAAMATSMLASTGAAIFSLGQRWRSGIFDRKADAMDGLSIVGNLIGAGAWAQGARVRALGQAGKTLDFVFVGARVATDGLQGILIAESRLAELQALTTDPRYPPDERARKLLALLAELTAVGLMTAISFRASAKEAEALSRKPIHLQGDPRANVADDQLGKVVVTTESIDTTAPPIAEGHTRDGKQKTTVTNPVQRAVVEPIDPYKTAFAREYSKKSHPWQNRKFTDQEIVLLDKDEFIFHAKCNKGTLEITIITKYDPAKNQVIAYRFPGVTRPIASDVLWAKKLYPAMYEYFEQVGNPVKRLKGLWAWNNADDAKVEFDRLKATHPGMSDNDAAKIAVKYARTYIDYHKPRGFTRVVAAKYLPEAGIMGDDLFSFIIERE